MGTRSDKRKFRRRRQRAGFVLLLSLILVVLGGVLFFRIGPFEEVASKKGALARVEAPLISVAPKALVAQQGAAKEEAAQKAEAAKNDAQQNNKEQSNKEQSNIREQQPAAKQEPAVPVPATNDMWLTVPKMDLYDNYVANSSDPAALDAGAAKLEESAFPWQEGATNTYISAHRVGWPGTASYYQFYDLPLLGYGDKIYLYDSNGTTYTYEVTEIFEVLPGETWVTGPVVGRDMISLQTCIENYGDYWSMGPNWYVRYVVRADKVAVDLA